MVRTKLSTQPQSDSVHCSTDNAQFCSPTHPNSVQYAQPAENERSRLTAEPTYPSLDTQGQPAASSLPYVQRNPAARTKQA